MASYVWDIETDSLDATVIHCLVLKEIETKEVLVFANGLGYPSVEEGIKLLQEADFWVFHNGIWFDLPVVNKLYKANLDPYKSIDTLVISRLLNSWDYSQHGLDSWGNRLEFPKLVFKQFEALTPEMITYCINDVELTYKVYQFFQPYIADDRLKPALRLEHDTAIIYREMHSNGFHFDVDRAKELRTEIEGLRAELDIAIQSSFPPRAKFLGEVLPKITKKGTISLVNFKWLASQSKDGSGLVTPTPEELGYQPNAPFSRIIWEEFNPASPKQVIGRLWEFGWEPYEKTKGHIKYDRERNPDPDKLANFARYGWTVSEANLETLPDTAPEAAKLLVRWLFLNSRISTLDTWLECYNPTTGKIHGEVRHIGTWTHRVSHKNPNTGNITRVNYINKEVAWGEEGKYGADFRSLWTASPGWKLVGCDAEGIQLRVLAHYMEDEAFTRALVSGSSKDGTDAHTMNMHKLNTVKQVCKDRDVAKTFIYSWLLGAAAPKSAQVLKCSVSDAVIARKSFLEGYPGLKRLKEEIIPEDVKRGFFYGFDGRPVMCDNAHLMLAGYLQNGETVIMKKANTIWYNELKKLKIPFRQVNFVHDEWQVEVLEKDGLPETAASIIAASIKQAGEELGLKCPMLGQAKFGYNWFQTH